MPPPRSPPSRASPAAIGWQETAVPIAGPEAVLGAGPQRSGAIDGTSAGAGDGPAGRQWDSRHRGTPELPFSGTEIWEPPLTETVTPLNPTFLYAETPLHPIPWPWHNPSSSFPAMPPFPAPSLSFSLEHGTWCPFPPFPVPKPIPSSPSPQILPSSTPATP